MIDLLKFLISKITGSEDFTVTETTDERGEVFEVKADPAIIGLIIGKEGKTIKNIRRIASIKGVFDKKSVNIKVIEKD
ncbi:MAG TPA: KH domain-containing protein [Patescibacteria group bacterium]|nr:KH domain-containing protein [Patescibacteria group bacterium]